MLDAILGWIKGLFGGKGTSQIGKGNESVSGITANNNSGPVVIANDGPVQINHYPPGEADGWTVDLPADLKRSLVSLELGTPPQVTRNIARSEDGQFWYVLWDTQNCRYRRSKVTEDYAARELREVVAYRGKTNWRELFGE